MSNSWIDPEVAGLGLRLLGKSEEPVADVSAASIVCRAKSGPGAEFIVVHYVARFHRRPEIPVHRAMIALCVQGSARVSLSIRSEVLAMVADALVQISKDAAFDLAAERNNWGAL